MKYIERDLGALESALIVPIADLHIGDPLFNEQAFIELRRWIEKTPNAFVLLLGDVLNCATKNSVSDVYEEELPPQKAKKKAFTLLKPIANKIIAIVTGNHEYRIWKESGNDIAEDLSFMLDVPYAREGALVNVKVGEYRNKGRVNYTIYGTHGRGTGRTKGAKINMLRRLRDIVLADVYVMGHIHDAMVNWGAYYVPDVRHRTILKIPQLFVSTGSFLEWGGYAERDIYEPTWPAIPKIRLSGRQKEFEVIC